MSARRHSRRSPAPKLLTVREARELLAREGLPMSRSAFYRFVADCSLPSTRLGGKIFLLRDLLLAWCSESRSELGLGALRLVEREARRARAGGVVPLPD
jgi:predicted DNA-binding transcriptional regulator AlpA